MSQLKRVIFSCVLFAANGAVASAQTYAFSTLAGRASTAGATDGAGGSARFNRPHGLALDAQGNLYVTESVGHTVRKITREGVVTTLAGLSGSPGNIDGTGSAARFGGTSSSTGSTVNIASGPFGIALDIAGNAFVADAHFNTVRRITATGVVSTFAGTGAQGTFDGPLATTRFYFPMAVAIDGTGAMFVADTYNHAIRRISTTGTVTTIAGTAGTWGTVDGIGEAARFLHPTTITISPTGIIFVGDSTNTIRRLTPLGSEWEVTTIAGRPFTYGTADGVGGAARFGGAPSAGSTPTTTTLRYSTFTPSPAVSAVLPTSTGSGTSYAIGDIAGLAADAAGNVFVADYMNNTIRKVSAGGVVTTIGGLALVSGSSDGLASEARFQRPAGIAVDAAGTLYIADSLNHTIRTASVAVAPTIQTQPASQTVVFGTNLVLGVSATGNPAPTFQWTRNGAVIAGATGATLTLANVGLAEAGTYAVTLSNALGVVSTTPFVVTVSGAPAFTQQPLAQTIAAGETIRLSAVAAGSPAPTYQWFRDGLALPDATGSTLTISNAAVSSAGDYTVVASNVLGSVTSSVARVTVGIGRIVNLSIRTALAGSETLIVGFVATGGAKPMLIRAVGPALRDFGVSGAMPDPQLALYNGATITASNDNWGVGSALAQLALTTTEVGAFALPANSLDAALLATIDAPMTTQVFARNAAGGIVLVELYDATPSSPSRLLNVSARTRVGTGDNILIAGFVVAGPTSRTVLIRAVGPTLGAFGVTGTLADPRLDVFAAGSTAVRASNDNWGGAAALTTAFSQVAAFEFPNATSRDAALIATLPPGGYTAQVSGVGNTTGEALLEIYELP